MVALNSLLPTIVCSIVTVGLSAGAAQEAGTPIPKGGKPVLRDPLEALSEPRENAKGGNRVVAADGPGFTRALEAESKVRGNNWEHQLRLGVTSPLKKGDVLLVHYWARTVFTADESGQSIIPTAIEVPNQWKLPQKERDLLKPLTRGVLTAAGSKWQQYFIPAECPRDTPAKDVALVFRCGSERQRVQLGGLTILNYGNAVTAKSLPVTRSSYAGRELHAPWRREARERIQKHRARDFKLRVLDAEGKPVKGAGVELELTRHAFGFGAAFRASDVVPEFNPGYAIARERIVDNFSSASFVNALKWHAWAGDWGPRMKRNVSLTALRWVAEQKLPFRGHCLVWPRFSSVSRAMRKMMEADTPDPVAIRAGILEHLRSISPETNFWMQEWDVINESIPCHDVQDICGDDVMVEWLEEARRLMPGVKLALNEYNILSSLSDGKKVGQHEERIKYLLDNGAPLDVLGLQGHIGGSPPSPQRMLSVLDRFAKFDLPIRITEFDIKADDPDLLYDFTRDFYTVLFSHPSVIGVQMWGLGQMFTKTGDLTPVGKAYRELAYETWHTRKTGTTDTNGVLTGKGFFGTYRLGLTVGDAATVRTLLLPEGNGSHTLEVQVGKPVK